MPRVRHKENSPGWKGAAVEYEKPCLPECWLLDATLTEVQPRIVVVSVIVYEKYDEICSVPQFTPSLAVSRLQVSELV